METNKMLEDAIGRRKPVRFRYAGSDGATGFRVGSPHALYAHPNTRKISCDIYQHEGGDSSTGNVQPFKPFILAKMSQVSIVEDEAFQEYELYDGDAPRYVNAIAKIH